MAIAKKINATIRPEQVFLISGVVVNGGNYLYNLMLGKLLGPTQFADVAILITLLLVLSFVATTFQLVIAKFTVEFEATAFSKFKQIAYRIASYVGFGFGALFVLFSEELQLLLQTSSSGMFVIFGVAMPVYFIMSVRRGIFQGQQEFVSLSQTYQLEMWSRLGITFFLILLCNISPVLGVSLGIAFSFLAGLFPWKKTSKSKKISYRFSSEEKREIINFILLTACYECTQIICNNSDILMVKHFFASRDAGLYASIALIGRVVYFITWMFVMMLLPKVIAKKKAGEDASQILWKYFGYTTLITISIVLFTFLFPQTTVSWLFGEAYVSVAPLLGWYALATALFALSNVLAYYYLALANYVPIICSMLMGFLQIGLIYHFHENLFEVILMQIIAMGGLLLLQLGYFVFHRRSKL